MKPGTVPRNYFKALRGQVFELLESFAGRLLLPRLVHLGGYRASGSVVTVSVPDLLGSSERFYSHFFLPLRIRGNFFGPINHHGRSTVMRVAQRFGPTVVIFFSFFLTTRSAVFSFALGLFPSVLAILVEFASNVAVLAVSSFPKMIGTLFPVLDMLAQYLGLVLSGRGLALALSARFALFAFLSSCGCLCSLGRLGSFGQSSARRPACVCRMVTVRAIWPVALSVLFHPEANRRTTRFWILLNRRYVRRTFILFAFAFTLLRSELPGFCLLERLF